MSHNFPELQPFVDKVSEEYGPDAIVVLFGSRARGEENEWSDYDVLLVTGDLDKNVTAVRKVVSKLQLDLHAMAPEELVARLERWKTAFKKKLAGKQTKFQVQDVIGWDALDGICLAGHEPFAAFRKMRDDWIRSGEILDPGLLRFVSIEDGLTDFQRKLLESTPTSKSRRHKCARIVFGGNKEACYSEVRLYALLLAMSQPWVQRYPLFEFQGNRGSREGMTPAAMRYTECRRSKYQDFGFTNVVPPATLRKVLEDLGQLMQSSEVTRQDVGQLVADAVGSDAQLVNLFPNLLANGTLGLPGIATQSPPFLLSRVVAALKQEIKSPETSDDDLLDTIGLPEFPCSGRILNPKETRAALANGEGLIQLGGTVEMTTADGSDQPVLAVTDLPFAIAGIQFEQELVAAKKAKKLTGVKSINNRCNWKLMRYELSLTKKAAAAPDALMETISTLPSMTNEIVIDIRVMKGDELVRCSVPDLIRFDAQQRITAHDGSVESAVTELDAIATLGECNAN